MLDILITKLQRCGNEMGCLYKLTSPSGKSYIGITSKTFDERWSKHVEHSLGKRDNGALYGAMRKYGIDSFTKEVLSYSDDWSELCRMEITAIAQHSTLAPNGYNISSGGDGVQGVRDEATKMKISVAQKKRFQNPEQRALLREYGERARKIMAVRPKVVKPPKPKLSKEEVSKRIRAGLSSPEVRKRMSEAATKRTSSPEWRAKMSMSKKGKKTKPASLERKEAIAAARRAEWSDPVMRQKRLAALSIARAAKTAKRNQSSTYLPTA